MIAKLTDGHGLVCAEVPVEFTRDLIKGEGVAQRCGLVDRAIINGHELGFCDPVEVATGGDITFRFGFKEGGVKLGRGIRRRLMTTIRRAILGKGSS